MVFVAYHMATACRMNVNWYSNKLFNVYIVHNTAYACMHMVGYSYNSNLIIVYVEVFDYYLE